LMGGRLFTPIEGKTVVIATPSAAGRKQSGDIFAMGLLRRARRFPA